jgi:hypothetical protein
MAARRTIIRTSKPDWFTDLSKAYKSHTAVRLVDDADFGVNPLNQTLFEMGVEAKLPPTQIAAACIALGMATVGVGLIVLAFIDPEPTSKLGILLAGGVVLIGTGGWGAIKILTNTKPPSVKVSRNGIQIDWD